MVILRPLGAAHVVFYDAAGGDWGPYEGHVQHVIAHGKTALDDIQEIRNAALFTDGKVHAYLGNCRNHEFVFGSLIDDVMDELRAKHQ